MTSRPRSEVLAAFAHKDNMDHPYCCQLKAAAEADLEVAWEMREANKVVSAALAVREHAADVADRKLYAVCFVTLAIHVALVAVNRGWVL